MKNFLVALQFLTILPIKITKVEESDYGRALLYFPFIGVLIGLFLSLFSLLSCILPDSIISALIVISSIILTGGIHLDGFADTCDGFYSSKTKEKILEIMRDSRTGSMGVIGIFCLLLLKFTLIVNIPQAILWKALIMMCAFSRWSIVYACYSSNYVHKQGKAKYFIEYNSKKEFLVGTFFVIALFLLLMKLKGIVLFIIALPLIFLFIDYIKRRIGGMSGDTIGATNEVSEISILILANLFL